MSVNLRRYVGVLAKRRFSLIGFGFGLGFEAKIRLGEFDFWSRFLIGFEFKSLSENDLLSFPLP